MRASVLLLTRLPPARLAELAATAEALGYVGFWLGDDRFYRDPYTALAHCAAATRGIGLGVGVADPYTRHPALVAMAIATLDEVSGGRALLGIGAGAIGLREMGIVPVKPARAMREMLELVRALLRGERVDVAGEVVSFHRGKLDFSPPRADLPIYVASNNRFGLRLAGELADGAIMNACVADPTLRFFREQVDRGIGGRDQRVERVARVNVCIDDDRSAAIEAVRPAIAVHLISQHPTYWTLEQLGIPVPDELRSVVAGLPVTHDRAVVAPVARAIPDHWVEALALVGSPEHIAARVTAMGRRGIDQTMVFPVTPDGDPSPVIRRFAEEVLPLVGGDRRGSQGRR